MPTFQVSANQTNLGVYEAVNANSAVIASFREAGYSIEAIWLDADGLIEVAAGYSEMLKPSEVVAVQVNENAIADAIEAAIKAERPNVSAADAAHIVGEVHDNFRAGFNQRAFSLNVTDEGCGVFSADVAFHEDYTKTVWIHDGHEDATVLALFRGDRAAIEDVANSFNADWIE